MELGARKSKMEPDSQITRGVAFRSQLLCATSCNNVAFDFIYLGRGE
jgi:hypothetical protein